jgi:serine/threonine protein phosphatase 1
MKYFVISDIHSNYNIMIDALNEKEFNFNDPNHKIILVGDAFDRGTDPVGMYLFIKEMINKNKLIWIVGNHEFLILKRLEEQVFKNHNDTYETLLKLALFNSNKTSLSDYEIFEELDKMGLKSFMLDNLIPFYETTNYVFAHGFIPLKKDKYIENWRDIKLLSWYTAATKNGMKKVMVDGIRIPDKTLVCGHCRCSYGNVRKEHDIKTWDNKIFEKQQKYKNNIEFFSPYYGNGVIGIDGCCGETGMINCLVIEE